MEKIQILYQDANVIIIGKPSGLLSVPFDNSGTKSAQGILERILRNRGEYSAQYRPLCVHRLDRDTSGVMMFAANERAQKAIMNSWHSMVKSRVYASLAENPVNFEKFGILPDCGIIDDALSYNAYNIGYVPRKTGGAHSERNAKKEIAARTHFKIIERGKQFSLFELELDTGRKNQIRAHLAAKGYPICGDKNYRAKTDPFGRLCLHARTLVYTDLWTKKTMSFEIPEPAEWHREVSRKKDVTKQSFGAEQKHRN